MPYCSKMKECSEEDPKRFTPHMEDDVCYCADCFEPETKNSTGLLKSKLIKHAATLLTERMSDIDDDYPRRFPKWALREIEEHNERLRLIAIDLRSVADAI